MSERHSELKIVRYTDRIQGILRGEGLAPVRANLDVTNLCQHHCPFCEPIEFRNATIADRRHTMQREVAEEVITDLRDMGCTAIQFSGGGEPLLHPNFGQLLAHVKLSGMHTFVITNGGLIGKWPSSIGQYADRIRISLDASCDEEHQEMHGSKPGEFDRVISNIQGFKRAGWPTEVGLAYIVTDCNSSWESIQRVMHLAAELHVDYVQFRPISEDTPQRLIQEEWSKVADRIRVACFPFDVKTYITGQRHRDVFLQRDFSKCYAALTLAVIGANGDVSACCDRRDLVFGNVNERRFRDIWLSAKHREMAAQIVPAFCGRCVQCGTNRGIERFVVNNEAAVEVI